MKIKLCGTVLTLSFLALYTLQSLYTHFKGVDLMIVSIPALLMWGLLLSWVVGHFLTKPYNAFNGGGPDGIIEHMINCKVNSKSTPEKKVDIVEQLNIAKTSFTRSSGHSKKHKVKK